MDSYNQTKAFSDDGYQVAYKMRQRDQLVRDKSRLQAELDSVTRQLGRDTLRLRDLQYAAKASVLNVSAGHEWNYRITKKSFVNDVEATCQSLKADCNRLEAHQLYLRREICSMELQITSLHL
ncbi:uncharacterized protein LOC130691673 [Daphnia carinata]|uniref:uncharacterized protein LOC130691673 n=1 Tax=Daphnia carinata TaxID=120202 RepID=UPI00257F0388|nr:uncharacterized protein LOC130691673 [Daphnia carinata]